METAMTFDALLKFLSDNLGFSRLPPVDPVVFGLIFVALGLALCFAGYLLFRLILGITGATTLSAAVTIVVLFITRDSPRADILAAAAAGGALLGFLLSWFYYRAVVFLSGAVVGALLGAALLAFTGGLLRESHPAALVVGIGIPALAFGALYLHGETVIITVMSALLGALFLAIGMRILDLGKAEVAASTAAIAFGLSVLVFLTRQTQGAEAQTRRARAAPAPARRR